MIQIRIPNYLRQIQLSKTRRPKYYDNSHPDKYPKKYQGNGRYGFKDGKLYDFVSNGYVIANEGVLEKPRHLMINGNIIMRLHSRVIQKIVWNLDDMFSRALKAQLSPKNASTVPFPWKVSLTFKTHYGFADWDIDNPWIYEKCFIDALKKHMGFDDSILKITNGGEKKFRPIRSFDEPELIVTIETDKDFDNGFNGIGPIRVEESSLGEPGEIEYSYFNERAIIYTGKKKVLYGAAQKAIRKLMFKCLNDLVPVQVPEELYEKYQKFFDEFKNYNIQTIIK
jgi:hypothetical protein